jgi:DNA segregation ATPase FtsK/SpoIIIE-like protein
MENRFAAMKAARKTETEEPPIFIVVDEMAFLMQSDRKKEYVRILNRVTLLGRAADMHLILCSQVSTQDVIPACIRDNMTNIVCIRQRDAGKYRYLLGDFPGRLPTIGYAYLFTPDMARPEKIESGKIFNFIQGGF